ncbi:MAG: S8 family serine peptidase [Desulfobacterales bacterium]
MIFICGFSLSSDENTRGTAGVYIDDISLSGIEWVFSGDEYGFKSGTSMATPVVAGVAGLVWSVRPDLTYAQVKEICWATDPVASLDGKVTSGGGSMPDPRCFWQPGRRLSGRRRIPNPTLRIPAVTAGVLLPPF